MNTKETKLLERIEVIGVPFGSRAFGCEYTEDSDYDYVVDDVITKKLEMFLTGNGIKYSTNKGKSGDGYDYIKNNVLFNENNLKFMLNGKTVNLITYTEDKMIKVQEIIKSIHKLLEEENLVSKKFRDDKESRIMIINGFFNAMFKTHDTEIDLDEIPF